MNTTDVNFALYSQQTLDAEDHLFVLKIQDTVRAAVDEARFSTVLGRMRESKQAQLNTQDLPGLVKLAGSSFGILEEEGKGILQHLIEDGDFTLYGLANAVTRPRDKAGGARLQRDDNVAAAVPEDQSDTGYEACRMTADSLI